MVDSSMNLDCLTRFDWPYSYKDDRVSAGIPKTVHRIDSTAARLHAAASFPFALSRARVGNGLGFVPGCWTLLVNTSVPSDAKKCRAEALTASMVCGLVPTFIKPM